MLLAMRFVHAMTRLLIFLGIAAGFAAPAMAGIGEWVSGDKARVRLITAGMDTAGNLNGGIEIELAPGWKTYWRSPGAAGIAPNADFSQSSNVRDVTISYPVPHRYDDGYGVSNVYEGIVLLPLDIAAGDDSSPVDLRLSLDIGVCEVVCIPEHFEVSLNVVPGVTDAAAARALAAARANLPGPPEPGVIAADRIVRQGGTDKRPVYELTVTAPSVRDAVVFVEGPPDWYSGPPEWLSGDDTVGNFLVSFDRLGARTPLEGARFNVTIAADDRAVEQVIGID